MILRFNLQKDGSSKAIVTVTVDEDGQIEHLSCSDPQLEMGLLNENSPNSFISFVRCAVLGNICSDQIDVLHNRRWMNYKAEQMA